MHTICRRDKYLLPPVVNLIDLKLFPRLQGKQKFKYGIGSLFFKLAISEDIPCPLHRFRIGKTISGIYLNQVRLHAGRIEGIVIDNQEGWIGVGMIIQPLPYLLSAKLGPFMAIHFGRGKIPDQSRGNTVFFKMLLQLLQFILVLPVGGDDDMCIKLHAQPGDVAAGIGTPVFDRASSG